MASSRKTTVVKAKKKPDVEGFDPYSGLEKELDRIEKEAEISDTTASLRERRLHTGSLVTDIVLGGGVTAGMYTNMGQEQSTKTTGAVTLEINAAKHGIPVIYHFDVENSTTAGIDYVEKQMRTQGLKGTIEDLYGVRDSKGNLIKNGWARIRDENIGEKFFNFMVKLINRLPDKVLIGDEWWYIYPDDKKSRSIVGDKYDKDYFATTGRLRIRAPNGDLQALVIVDSWVALIPELMDAEDSKSGMGAKARMFADQLPRVSGKLRRKRVCLYGINQIRTRPGFNMGDPTYEPGGDTLKFTSGARIRFTSRSLSGVPEGGGDTGQVMTEPSVTGSGEDTYRYISIKAIKNKYGVPYQEGWLRLWITDRKGHACGYDPVWDTYQYLKSTGQIEGTRKKFRINMVNASGKTLYATKPYLSWLDFKSMILIRSRDERTKLFKRLKVELADIRGMCIKQMGNGQGLDLYFAEKTRQQEAKNSRASKKVGKVID